MTFTCHSAALTQAAGSAGARLSWAQTSQGLEKGGLPSVGLVGPGASLDTSWGSHGIFADPRAAQGRAKLDP